MGAQQSAEQMRETTYEVEHYSISAKAYKNRIRNLKTVVPTAKGTPAFVI